MVASRCLVIGYNVGTAWMLSLVCYSALQFLLNDANVYVYRDCGVMDMECFKCAVV